MSEKSESVAAAGNARLALFCALLCSACVAAAFLFVKATKPAETRISLLSAADEGRFVAVYGRLASPKNAFYGFSGLLCGGGGAGGCVSLFIPPRLAERISGSSVDLSKIRSGARLRVEGVVREDERGLSAGRGVQIEVVTPDAVEFLGYA